MENQVSLVDLKRQFKEIVGFRAPAPISKDGALRSAGIIVDVEEKLIKNKQSSPDLFRVVIATSQLLQWFDQENKKVISGDKNMPGNPERRNEIIKKFERGGNVEEELKELSQELYVVDPVLGAKKAMELLQTLHNKYPEVSLKQDLPSE